MKIVFLAFMVLFLSLGTCCAPTVPSTVLISSTRPSPETVTPAAVTPVTVIPLTQTVIPETVHPPTPTPPTPTLNVVKTIEETMETPQPLAEPLTITLVYDNNRFDPRLKTAWGFSALVEYHNHTLLFDTGGDGPTLVENMRILGIDPHKIDSMVLSHAHGDHTGGLSALLDSGARPAVYLPPSFPASFKSQVRNLTRVLEVKPGLMIGEGIYTTGEIGQAIPEQALAIRTGRGLVIITGCAHPGIIRIIEQARELFAEPVRLVVGGFHLGGKSPAEIDAILSDFRRLGVDQVAPCHCTGEQAIGMFASEYGENYIQAGAGKIFELDSAGQ